MLSMLSVGEDQKGIPCMDCTFDERPGYDVRLTYERRDTAE